MADGTNYSLTDDEIRSASDALKAQEEERRAYRQQSWDMTQPPPDQAAEAMKLGDKYGVPRQAVEADPDFWRQRDADAQRRLMESASPKTMAWLDDEENYSVGKDDLDIWGSIEGYFGDLARDPITTGAKTGSAIGGAAKAGWLSFQSTGADADREQLEKADRYYDELDAWKAREAERTAAGKGGFMGRLGFNTVDVGTLRLQLPGDTDPMPEPTSRLIDEAFKKDREWWQTALGLPGKGYRENPREVVTAIKPLIQDKMDEAVRVSMAKNKAVDEAMPQTGDFLADSLLGGVRAITEMTPLIVSAIATRGKSVPTVVMGTQVYYNEYATGRERELGINKATERAVLQAGVEAVSERVSLGIIDNMLKDNGSLALRFGKGMILEQGQEQLATMGGRLVDWSYLEQGKTLDEFVAETPRSMLQTSITTLVASSGMQSTFLAVDYATKALINDSLMMQPSKADKKIDDLLNAVSKSKLRTRSPEKAAALATQLAEGTGAETVVIDLDGLAQSLEAAGLNITEAMTEMGIPADAINETAIVMGQVEVPTARLMVSEGIQTHRDKVQPHLRLKGEDLTPAQKEAIGAEATSQAAKFSEAIREDVARDADFAGQIAEVEDQVTEQLRTAGFSGQNSVLRANAVLASRMAAYVAKRRGQDVRDVWKEIGPKIVGSFGEAGSTDVLRQAEESGYTGADRGEAESWLSAVEKGLPMETEARMARAKEMGFDTETVLYHGTDKDFAEFALPNSNEPAVFLSPDPKGAEVFASSRFIEDGKLGPLKAREGGHIMPVVVRGRIKTITADGTYSESRMREFIAEAKAEGFDGVRIEGMKDTVGNSQLAIFDPANIRSVHAAFDPDQSGSSDLLAQSIRKAAALPMSEVDAWVRANITADESTFPNGDTLTVVRFPLTEDDGAPEVMLSIRMKADGKQSGRADVNLFLDNQMADAMDTVEDVAQRSRMAMEMFGKAVLVLRQYAAEYDPRAFSFVAAESQAEGTKAKSREDLYRYMLSSMKMEGYTAYEVESQTSVVNTDADGAKTANPMFPSAGFMLVKDGENVEDFARNEVLRGNQRGGGAGEVVTALTAKKLTPDIDASGRRVDRGGSRVRAAGAGGDRQQQTDDTLAQTVLANPEVREAMDDPETDVLPLTDDMQVTELDEFLAFHGTLAKFDKFEMDKMGSGEGAQAFGPGHYFTQSRGVAEWYRKRMKQLAPGLRMGKEAYNKSNPAHFAMSEYWKYRDKLLHHDLFGGYKSLASDVTHSLAIKRAIFSLEFELDQIRDPLTYPGRGRSTEYATPERAVIKDQQEMIRFLEAGIAHLKTLDPNSTRGIPKPSKKALRGGGNIYTVAVKLPSEFTIQLDLSFGEQPAKVQAAFRAAVEQGTLGDVAKAALEKYGDKTRMTVLVAALKAKDSPAMAVMRANGIRGVRYLDGLSRGKKNKAGQTYNYVVFDDADVKVIDRTGFLFQSMDGVQQERRGGYSPSTRQIVFTEARDVSTFMHETAHWFLDTLEKLAPTEAWAAADLAEIEAWWGGVKDTPAMAAVRARYSVVPSGGGWQVLYRGQPMERPFASEAEATARIEWRERQEAFAETFEQYLQTGKAPTPKLVEVFRAFRDWLVNLYKGMAPREREALSPAILAVFDRVLAVDTEVDAASAEAFRDADTMAKEMLEKGVITERQYRMVGERLNKAREEVKEEMIARALKEEMRTREDWWAKERARVKGDLARAFDKSEVGRAFNWLAYGEWKGDVEESTEDLARDDSVELYQAFEIARPDVDLDQFSLSAKQREVAQMILDGAPYADIEEVLGLTRMQLASYIKEARKKGVPLPKQAPIARSAVSRLEAQVDIIVDLFVEGASLAQMGAILNADQTTVGDFVRKLKADGVITEEHIAANEARKKSNKQPQRIQEASVFRERARGYFKEGDLEFVEFRDDRLSDRDNKMVEMARNGASNLDIAEEWDVSVRTASGVLTKARRLGIDVPYATNAQDAPLIERVLRLEEKGMTNVQIAEVIETTVSNVSDALARAAEKGLYVPIKERVIEAWKAGKGVAKIADETRRSPALIRRYLADAGLIQKQDKFSRYLAPARRNNIVSYGGATLLSDDSLSQSAPVFYSALSRFLETNKTAKAPAAQWKGMIQNAPGIKAEEVEWTGVMEWLDLQSGSVTREAVAAFVEANGVRVEEVSKGGGATNDELQRRLLPLIEERERLRADLDRTRELLDVDQYAEYEREVTDKIDDIEKDIDRLEAGRLPVGEDATKWSSYTLPGGENYREMLLTLPVTRAQRADMLSRNEDGEQLIDLEDVDPGVTGKPEQPAFRSSHWSEPNVLAHVRFKERTGPNGERVLALEEIQSDWHQAGRERGYNDAESKARRQQEVDDAKQRGDAAADLAREASERNKALWDQLRVGGMATQQDMPNAEPMDVARENQRRFRQGLINLGMEQATYGWLGADDVQNVMREFGDRIEKVAKSDTITLEIMFPGLSDYSLLQAIIAAQRDFMSAVASREAAYARMRSLESIQGVPSAPFKNNAWTELVLKRMIRFAAENGFDAVAWIPGNIQNGRVVETDDNRGDFYDKIVPNAANKIGKKFGARVERMPFSDAMSDDAYLLPDGDPVRVSFRTAMQAYALVWEDGSVWGSYETEEDAEAALEGWDGAGREGVLFHSLPITPELREAAVNEGFPLFQTRTFNPPGHGPVAPPPDVPPVRLDLKIVRDLYGEEALRKLPAAVRRRSSTSSNVTDMLQQIETVRKTLAKRRKGPQTLTQFIMAKKRTKQDGTKEDIPWGIKGAADELKAMGLGKLINEKSGRTLDYVREAAEEAGFIRPRAIDADLNREASDLDTTTNDLLEALGREAKGEAVVRIGEEGDTKEAEDARVWADWLSQNGVDIYEADKKVLKASVEAMLSQTDESLISPDQAAELFGFPNGEELLNALAQVGNRDKFLNEQADRKMAEEFGDMMKDGTLIEEAREAARLDILGRQSEIELEALSRAVGQQASANYAKQMARDIIALRTVKEIAAYERDLDNERRFSKQALSAVAKGDYAAALKAKQRQIIAAQMYREGKKAHERIEKQRKDLLKYLTSEGRRDKIDAGYLEKIEDILDAFELRVSKQGPAVQRERTSAAKYVAEMDAAGREDEVAPEARLLAELAAKTTWRNLTGAEVEYLVGTVSNLAHLGRTKDSLIRAQEKRKFRAVIDSLTDRMNQTGKLPGVTRERSPSKTAAEMLVDTLREGHSWLMRPEHQARSLDGGELGPIWDAIFRPMAEAADVESRMMREATELYRAAWSKFSMAERNAMSKRTVSVPELPVIGKRFTRLDLISIALNWGVPYNREVLLEGYGWTADQVEAALFRTLDDSHWDLVESIWAISGMYKAEAFAVEKDMTGVEPKSVEGISFTLPSGRKIEGKYYHIQYDASQPGKMSRRQAKDNDAEALSSHRKSRTKAMTKNGGLIERKGSGGRKVKLGLSVFEKALSETVHDIAFRRAVYDVGRIVADDQFADTYQDVAGMEAYRQLNVWLKDVAMPPMEVLDPIVKAFAHVRRNIPLAVMGYKVGTALIQPTGLLAAMPLVGHRRVAFAVAKAFANPKGSMYASWKQVAAMSEFMRDRVAGYERDVRETTTAMTKGGGLDFIRRNAFVFITGIDIAVSVPTWMAAYGKAMDGKVKGIDAGVEEDAIAYADSIIRRTQTAGKTQDLSRFQRGGEFQKQISMIFGYFNNLYALSAQQTLDMRRGNLSRAEWAWHMSVLFVAIPLLAEVFAGRLFPDDDDDEATLEGNIALTIISNFTGMFPGIRDAVSVNIKPEFGYRMSPTAKFVEDAAKTVGLPAQLLLDEERELTEADVKRAVNTVGAITGLPSAQINITGDYIVDALEGSEDPMADPADAAREAFVRNSR